MQQIRQKKIDERQLALVRLFVVLGLSVLSVVAELHLESEVVMCADKPCPLSDYLKLLERAIIHFRHRLRCDEQISLDEVHDFMDALHNIPSLLLQDSSADPTILSQRRETVELDLQAYDEKWVHGRNDARRWSLTGLLDGIRDEP